MGRKPFGSYTLEERLAVGGMGELFLASTSSDRPLSVVKILHRDFLESEEFVSMFEDEGRIGARLAHPNIVGVHDTGKVGDVPYISFEFIDGENLRTVLKAASAVGMPVPPEISLRIAVGVLLGLDHAHRAKDERGRAMNLVHRDLSPDNIVISWDGEPKILDFGIAKADNRSTHTQVGILKGKSQYMAPEQAKLGLVDQRSDLFSAGIVLLELLTGKKRFELDDPVRQIIAAQEWTATRPSDQAPWLPAEMDAIVLKALARAPENRFQSAEEFAVALTRVLQQGMLPRSETIASFLRRVFPGRTKRAGLGSVDEQTLHPRTPATSTPPPRTPSPTVRKTPVFAPPPVEVQRESDESTRTATAERFDDDETRAVASAAVFDDGATRATASDRGVRSAFGDERDTRASPVIPLPPDDGRTRVAPNPSQPRFDDETDNAARPTAKMRPAEPPIDSPSRSTAPPATPREPPVPPPIIRPPGSTPRTGGRLDIPVDDGVYDEFEMPETAPIRSEIRRGVPVAARKRNSVGGGRRRIVAKMLLSVGVLAGGAALLSQNRATLGSVPQIASALAWLGIPAPAGPTATPALVGTDGELAMSSSNQSDPTPEPEATPSEAPVLAAPSATPIAVVAATPTPVPTIRAADLAKPLSASVRVTSDPPGFEVLVDYVPTGKRTPTTVLLSPGKHVIGVDAEGFRAWEYEDTFRAGPTITVPAALIPED